MSRTRTAIMGRDFWRQRAYSIYWRRCMHMKRPEDGRPNGAAALHAFSSDGAVRAGDFPGVRYARATETDRAREVRRVVVCDVSAGGDCTGLADVSGVAVSGSGARAYLLFVRFGES